MARIAACHPLTWQQGVLREISCVIEIQVGETSEPDNSAQEEEVADATLVLDHRAHVLGPGRGDATGIGKQTHDSG